ncbi:peptide-methionine (S)-S-oxide reductase MsrA [Spiroplasma taiwanense]|uniref:Peptide methionine sulfoxide reductase MsrA n=1 Tax=Spiroplasma taiwanense CT-1 TaxID=1276220 RepID=S5MH04_9MOLU|nr:peptide-methionine (S)-S-oxide reductase MsrA [Spiroplasma taiwanense]AGR41130.1 peptide methionine sulfoxide reductase MsrA/MsrB [Spiroplasma taiwanense CT-1]
MKEIILAAGCFWGTQAYFDRTTGIVKTEVGYANGNKDSITYQEVCKGNTNFVEVCKVIFDESKITFEKLLEDFFSIINPTLLNRQGNDIGTQYRTGIYYNGDDKSFFEEKVISKISQLEEKLSKKVYTEFLPLQKYVKAEEYHQKYLDKNPNGYCHIDITKAK